MGGPKIAIQKTETDAVFPWEWIVTDAEHTHYCDGTERTFEDALAESLLTFKRMVEEDDVTITHDNHEPGVIYVGPDADPAYRGDLLIFNSPDGEGRYYWPSIAEAKANLIDDHTVRYVARIEV